MFSIIIPTYNEGDQIASTIAAARAAANAQHKLEILVMDGGSTDDTRLIAEQCGARVTVSERKGRAAQMNAGAVAARYPWLYFLHADSIPPNDFTSQLMKAIGSGVKSGCFRLQFDHDHWFLKVNAWFTRFDVNAVRFGDQSLFVAKDVFQKAGGFNENLVMMEDQEIIHRLKKEGPFQVLNGVVTTSARKYMENGIYRMQGIFFRLWAMYYLGYSQQQLVAVYKQLIRKHKL